MSVTEFSDDAKSWPRNFDRLRTVTDDRLLFILTCVVAIVLIAVNVPRLFEFNFWGDEALSILYSRKSFEEIIVYARDIDAHPPLFNLVLSFMTKVFGTTPFVYHLVPFISYVGILIISITFVRKTFGPLVAITFMLLATFLDSATYYIPEVRMYELGAFFVLASYVSLYLILRDGDRKSYILFVISSLCASYTHYYCLMAVGLLYVGLFFYFIMRKDWKGFKCYLIAALITVLGYLPWFFASLVKTLTRVVEIFWIPEQMSFEESIAYVFNNSEHLYVIIALFLLIILALITRTIWNKYKKESAEKTDDNIVLVWIIFGILSVFGSIALGQLISSMTRPLILDRYLYPVSVIIWLVFAVGISRITSRKYIRTTISLLVRAMILVICVPNFCETVKVEEERNEYTAQVIDLTYSYLSPGDNIVTNNNHMQQSLSKIYFPDLTISFINEDVKKVPKLDHSHNHLMFLTYEVQVVDIEDQINAQGYEVVLIQRGWFASNYYMAIYELRPIVT